MTLGGLKTQLRGRKFTKCTKSCSTQMVGSGLYWPHVPEMPLLSVSDVDSSTNATQWTEELNLSSPSPHFLWLATQPKPTHLGTENVDFTTSSFAFDHLFCPGLTCPKLICRVTRGFTVLTLPVSIFTAEDNIAPAHVSVKHTSMRSVSSSI